MLRRKTNSTHGSAWRHSALAGADNDKEMKGKHFKQVSTPQVGDIGWWDGHMAIYDLNAGMCGKKNDIAANLWSASSLISKRNYGASHISFYADKGSVTWYRYWKAP